MRLRVLAALAFLFVLPFGVAWGNEAADRLLGLAPADAGMTILIQDLRDHARRFFESPLSRELGKLPAVRQWSESERGQALQQAKRQIARVAGEEVATLRDDLLGDAVALVLRLGPEERPDQARGLLLTHVRNRELLDRLIHEFNSAQVRKGELARVVGKDWRGSAYWARVYQDPKRPTEFYATLDQTFAWSNSEELLRGVLERHAARTSGLSQRPEFRRVRDKLPRGAAVSLFLDGAFLRRSLEASRKPPADDPIGALIGRYVGALDYAGAAAEWREGLVVHSEEALRPERVDPWIKAWAAREARIAPDLRRVPATALAAASVYADFPALLQAVESVVPDGARTKLGNGLEVLKGVLLGRDVRTEILPFVGPGVMAYLDRPQQGDGLPFVLSVDLGGDSQVGPALENGLRTLLALRGLDEKKAGPNSSVRMREVDGVPVTSLEPQSPFAFAVSGGRLVIGRTPEAVGRASRADGNAALAALRTERFPESDSFACIDLDALQTVVAFHRAAVAKRLAARNHRPEDRELEDLDQALALMRLFRAAYFTTAMAADASAVHRTAGLVAREPGH